jgi:hypothetical protein
MDQNQKMLVDLLSLSLQGKKATYDLMKSAEWTSIIMLARNHSILPLIFTTLNHDWIDQKILVDLKSSVYSITLQQIQNLGILEKVIDEFNRVGIPLIIMKGLILRNLYPYPETRTMSDFDLAVKQEYFEDSIWILKKLGFRIEGHERMVHVQMRYENLLLELHRNLFDESHESLPQNYMYEMWKNAIPVSIFGKEVLSYSDMDNMLYLLLHAAKHFREGGFGLRQLCDIVLFVRDKQDTIKWEQFYKKVDNLRISRFTLSVFAICNRLFDMTIPEYLRQMKMPDDQLLDSFIRDILEGGTFGKNTIVGQTSSNIIHKIGFHDYNEHRQFFGLIRFLFPMPSRLGEKYFFAKKYPLLLPVAWVHRWTCNIVNKQQREMMKVVLNKDSAKESFDIMRNRGELVNLIRDEK